jgi:HEAT repeat protein
MTAKFAGKLLFRVIGMGARRSYLIVLLLTIGCQQSVISAEKPVAVVRETVTKPELDTQLKVNRDALLKGSSEQIRIDAATVLLVSDNPLARKILLETLEQPENSAARAAICKALSLYRAEQKAVSDANDFIQPLLGMLPSENAADAKLAAEALLLFDYGQISGQIEKMASDNSLPAKARLNVVYALKVQPDKKAVIKLLRLVDDPEKQIAATAEGALRTLGMPVGEDAETRDEIIYELQRKGRDEFLRDWLIRQEAQMRELGVELQWWQKQHLAALSIIYDGIGPDEEKGKFLSERLDSPKVLVKLWALEKVSEWRKSTNPKLPPELEPILVNLISDADKDVRLKTAQLLSLMGKLNSGSAEKLLARLKVEQEDDVQVELFVALGWVCHYALLPNASVKIPEEVIKQTLAWAEKYLLGEDTKKAQKGADVIKKLLGQNGLAVEEVDKYLGLLAKRYNDQKNVANGGALRGELLNTMAVLCGQGSACRDKAARLFRPFFEGGLSNETDLVREAAVNGLINIDKAMALRILREFVNDSSVNVRKMIMRLASDVGGKEDLTWIEKMGSSGDSDQAWQAMLTIFKRSDVVVLGQWMGRFEQENTNLKLSDEQRTAFLETLESKVDGKSNPEMVANVREKLAHLYAKRGEYERSAKYWGGLLETAKEAGQRDRIRGELLDVYLRGGNFEAAGLLIANCLLEKDLDSNNVVVSTIERFLDGAQGTVSKTLLEELGKIQAPAGRTAWLERRKSWLERFGGQPEDPNKPATGGEKSTFLSNER